MGGREYVSYTHNATSSSCSVLPYNSHTHTRGRSSRRGRGNSHGDRVNGREDGREWTSVASDVQVNEFTKEVGPTIPIVDDGGASLFSLFFPDELIQLIVDETNRYAKECLASKGSDEHWETNIEKLKAYLGFTILMGLNKLPHIYDYWSTNPVFH